MSRFVTIEPPREKNQRFSYAKTRTQIATWIVQFLYFLNTKLQASSHLQWLSSLVCVGPGQNPHCWFGGGSTLALIF